MQQTIKRLDAFWDKKACVLWTKFQFSDGHEVSVGVPLAHVVATFDATARSMGIQLAPVVGDVESVDGFFGSIAKAVKSGVKGVSKAVSATARTIDRGVSSAAKVVRSKQLGFAVNVFKFVPVVGQTAYAAHSAAKRAADTYDKAKATANQVVRTGQSSIVAARQIARGRNIQRSVAQLRANANTPEARMALAALQSV